MVKLLLTTSKVNIDSTDNDDRTKLSEAAQEGHEAVVKPLLMTVLRIPRAISLRAALGCEARAAAWYEYLKLPDCLQ